MDVDIRIPIGLLFAILGLILVVFGLYSMNDAELYARSLGRNINLWTGLAMLLFGVLMLFFTLKKKKTS
jgi:hypothetical protein